MQTRYHLIAVLALLLVAGCSTTSSDRALPAVEYGPDEHPAGQFQDWEPKPISSVEYERQQYESATNFLAAMNCRPMYFYRTNVIRPGDLVYTNVVTTEVWFATP